MARLTCIILDIINLILSFIPLLGPVGAIRSTWKNNASLTASVTLSLFVNTSFEQLIQVAAHLSRIALAITVLVAVKCEWDLTTAIQLVRAAILWQASLGVCPSNLVETAF